MNRICQMLGIRYPIIQGAMTNVSDAELVSAVSEGGGLGVYAPGIENVDFDVVRQEIRRIREKTTKPFAVNIMLASQYAAGLVEVVCQERVPVVTTGAGNPSKYMEAFHAAGIKFAPVVPSVEAAVKMEAAGVDFVIAEGMESGGYIGRVSTLVLIPQVVDAVNIPVAAAGGIMDGRTMAAVMMLGAEGVQMGTRFLTAAECTIPDYCKDAILAAKTTDAIVLGDRVGAKARLRVLKTKVTADILAAEGETTIGEFESSVETARKARYSNGLDGTLIGTGQCVGRVKDRIPAKEIIEGMAAEYESLVKPQLRLPVHGPHKKNERSLLR